MAHQLAPWRHFLTREPIELPKIMATCDELLGNKWQQKDDYLFYHYFISSYSINILLKNRKKKGSAEKIKQVSVLVLQKLRE